MRPQAFCILKTLSDGSPHWVEAARTLEAAKARIELLADLWPGKYIVLNQETGEPVSITNAASEKPGGQRNLNAVGELRSWGFQFQHERLRRKP